MKKSLAKKITLSILAGAVLLSSNVVWAGFNPDLAGWNHSSGWYECDVNHDGTIDGTGHTFLILFQGKLLILKEKLIMLML